MKEKGCEAPCRIWKVLSHSDTMSQLSVLCEEAEGESFLRVENPVIEGCETWCREDLLRGGSMPLRIQVSENRGGLLALLGFARATSSFAFHCINVPAIQKAARRHVRCSGAVYHWLLHNGNELLTIFYPRGKLPPPSPVCRIFTCASILHSSNLRL